MDPVIVTNLVPGIIILVLGVWCYTKKKGAVPLYIGIAFGLFAVSHAITLLGFATSLTALLVTIRLVAYLLVIFALYTMLVRR